MCDWFLTVLRVLRGLWKFVIRFGGFVLDGDLGGLRDRARRCCFVRSIFLMVFLFRQEILSVRRVFLAKTRARKEALRACYLFLLWFEALRAHTVEGRAPEEAATVTTEVRLAVLVLHDGQAVRS